LTSSAALAGLSAPSAFGAVATVDRAMDRTGEFRQNCRRRRNRIAARLARIIIRVSGVRVPPPASQRRAESGPPGRRNPAQMAQGGKGNGKVFTPSVCGRASAGEPPRSTAGPKPSQQLIQRLAFVLVVWADPTIGAGLGDSPQPARLKHRARGRQPLRGRALRALDCRSRGAGLAGRSGQSLCGLPAREKVLGGTSQISIAAHSPAFLASASPRGRSCSLAVIISRFGSSARLPLDIESSFTAVGSPFKSGGDLP
jgi:hypothetical protein